MTSPSSPSETLHLLLHHLLPLLLSASQSVKSFVSRWRLLHSKLTHLHSSLSSASLSLSLSSNPNPLFLSLLPSLLSTLHSLSSLSSRCLDPSLPSGKLLLQSDLDIASSSLSLHLHDLDLLLSSGLLLLPSSHPPNAIVLPLPSPSASKPDLLLFLRDLFARLQIGALDLKQNSLHSLLHFLSSDPSKFSLLVAQEGDIASLIRLLDVSNHSVIRDQAAAAVSILSTASEVSCKAVFEEGALGPLLRLLDSGSAAVKEHAAAAINAMTADPSNAWAVNAYNGVPILIAACRSGGGSPAVHALAAGSIRNVSAVGDLRIAVVEEGGVPVLVDLLLSGTALAQKNAVLALCSLASSADDEEIRLSIVQEGGLDRLVQLIGEASDPEILEHSLRAVEALSASPPAARSLSSSLHFFSQLTDLVRRGNAAVQQIAASLLSILSPSDEIKRSMAGCMPSLIKMLEFPKPVTAQEAAAQALVSLLAVRSNRKEMAKDEKSVTRLVQMLDPKREEVCKKFPVSVVLALAGSGSGRRRLVESGACQVLSKLVDADVPGAKKASQRITGSRLKSLFSMSWRE